MPVPEPAPVEVPAAPRTWQLDPAASTLFVLVRHDPDTALSNLAHDHTVAATGWRGTVTWDPADVAACAIEITVPVAGLVVDPPGLRARAGLEGETDEGDKVKISENLWGRSQLDVSRFPSITFVSDGCVAGEGAVVTVTGQLTIHGVSRPVSVPMTIAVGGDGFSARGTFPSAVSSFGFAPFTAAMGLVKNLDRIDFTIDVKGR